MHHDFVGRFLSRLPPDGRVLDAACGTGKYFPMVLASDRGLLGVDHAGALLANAAAKFPQVPTDKHDLQELPYRDEFDGVMCVTPWSSSHRRTGRLSWSAFAGPCAPRAGCI
jgi:ubiquinone/menaquinone biosynthesis C-methylase UbiE